MSIDRAGWPFIAAALAVTVGVAWWGGPWFALLPALVTVWVVWFFRDPEREIPAGAGLLVSPADGKIIVASSRKISVFMNVFNVHVCRTPHEGAVRSVEHSSGNFRAAWRDDASDHNERATIEVACGAFCFRFVLVAGLVARRIVCRVGAGRTLARGERVGLIRFGSRVDVLLPDGCAPEVSVGDRVYAGRTILARRSGSEDVAEAGPGDFGYSGGESPEAGGRE